MLKKIGLPMMALAGLLMFAPNQAKAGVRVGVVVGAPAYRYPVYPRVYAPVYPAPAYVAPAYAYPYATWGWDRGVRREREWRGHDGFRRDRR